MEFSKQKISEGTSADVMERHRYLRAQNRLKELKAFYIHLMVYLIINSVIVYVNIEHEEVMALSSFGTAILWGIGILVHAAVVFLPNFILGQNWEEMKVQQIFKKYKSEHYGKSTE